MKTGRETLMMRSGNMGMLSTTPPSMTHFVPYLSLSCASAFTVSYRALREDFRVATYPSGGW